MMDTEKMLENWRAEPLVPLELPADIEGLPGQKSP
jgi:hypothetical protein